MGAQFHQPAQGHLGEGGTETAAGRLAQVAQPLRGVAHAGLAAVQPHQAPAPVAGRGMFGQRSQRAQRGLADGLEHVHARGGAALAQVAVRDFHAGQLEHVGREGAGPAQEMEDQPLHQLGAGQLGLLAAGLGTVLAPELRQGRQGQQMLERGAERADGLNQRTGNRLHPQRDGGSYVKVQVLSF